MYKQSGLYRKSFRYEKELTEDPEIFFWKALSLTLYPPFFPSLFLSPLPTSLLYPSSSPTPPHPFHPPRSLPSSLPLLYPKLEFVMNYQKIRNLPPVLIENLAVVVVKLLPIPSTHPSSPPSLLPSPHPSLPSLHPSLSPLSYYRIFNSLIR